MTTLVTLFNHLSNVPGIFTRLTQTSFFIKASLVWVQTKKIWIDLLDQFLVNTTFVSTYYRRNENLWQDGFLIDFLQKKIVDKWTRKFLVISSYLFNERLVFDRVIRAYLDLVVWSGNKIVIFEYNNVASTLLTSSLTLILLFLVISLNYWFVLFL